LTGNSESNVSVHAEVEALLGGEVAEGVALRVGSRTRSDPKRSLNDKQDSQ
jgi:hypothetical protein